MPNINNLPVKTNKKKPKVLSKTKTKKSKQSPIDYYKCLLTAAQQNWIDPTTGSKKKITSCCKECKTKAPVLREQRTKEVQKLIVAYQQVGECLTKLLKPLKD